MAVLTLNNIKKSYGKIQALKGVSFEVPQGSIFGILGPNGSGKTTLLGIVMDVLKASDGTYDWFGNGSSEDQRKQIGTLLETPNFYHYLSADRNLRIASEIKQRGGDDIDNVLKKVNLYERRHSKFSTFSLGMKQRLAIAAALLGNPSVLVLDEPTNGLDPVGIAETRALVRSLAQEGKTVIMASHLLDEVERVCDHVAILQKGQLIISGRVDEVLVNEDVIEVSASGREDLSSLLADFPGAKSIRASDKKTQLLFENGTADLGAVNKYCFERGIVLDHLLLKKKSLETKFFELTSKISVD